MRNQILLFKDFNVALPKEFLEHLEICCSDAIIYTVRGENDFNRWQLDYRVEPAVLDCVTLTNKKHNNILEPLLEVVTIPGDHFTGFIEFDDNGREHWKSKGHS
jgi:hypothetical protein